MFKNVGGVDRAVRIVVGLGILSLAFVGPQTPWGYLGLVPLVTGLIGWCPAYMPWRQNLQDRLTAYPSAPLAYDGSRQRLRRCQRG